MTEGEHNHKLQLTFLTTGATQHVFTNSKQPENGWVYKIPAAFGRVVPLRTGARSIEPWNRSLAVLQVLFYKFPSKLAALTHKTGKQADFEYILAKSLNAVAIKLTTILAHAGDCLLSAYLRYGHKKRFHSMLLILDALSKGGLNDVLLPYRIIPHARATLWVNGKSFAYQGPILMQRRADRFFEHAEQVEEFDWQQFITAQQKLWRSGFALSDAAEVLGPSNWALLDGRVRLGDTLSLTTNYEEAIDTLNHKILDDREQWLLGLMVETERPRTVEFFTQVRGEINADCLKQLWKTDVLT